MRKKDSFFKSNESKEKYSCFLTKVLWRGDQATTVVTAIPTLCFSHLQLFSIALPHRHKVITISVGKVRIKSPCTDFANVGLRKFDACC